MCNHTKCCYNKVGRRVISPITLLHRLILSKLIMRAISGAQLQLLLTTITILVISFTNNYRTCSSTLVLQRCNVTVFIHSPSQCMVPDDLRCYSLPKICNAVVRFSFTKPSCFQVCSPVRLCVVFGNDVTFVVVLFIHKTVQIGDAGYNPAIVCVCCCFHSQKWCVSNKGVLR